MRIENRTKAPIMVPVFGKDGKPEKSSVGAAVTKTIYPYDRDLRAEGEPDVLTVTSEEWAATKKHAPSVAKLVEAGDLRELT